MDQSPTRHYLPSSRDGYCTVLEIQRCLSSPEVQPFHDLNIAWRTAAVTNGRREPALRAYVMPHINLEPDYVLLQLATRSPYNLNCIMSTRSRARSVPKPPFQAVVYPPWLGWRLPRTLTPSQAKHLYLHIKTVAFYLDALTAFIPQTRDLPFQVSSRSNHLNSAKSIHFFLII